MDPIFDPEERDLEEALLRAGRDVTMSAELRSKTLAALAASTVGVTAAATAKASTSSWLTSKAGWLWAATVVGATGAAALAITLTSSPAPLEEETAPPTEVQVDQKVPHPSAPGQTQGADTLSPPNEPPAPTPAPLKLEPQLPKAPAAGAPSRKATPREQRPSLREELSHLGQVEAALNSGQPGRALTLLADYKKRFKPRRLSLEAEVLNIQALHDSGSVAAARDHAARFLKAHPRSPLGARAKRFVR